jgi:hypothetical protein
MAAPPIVLQVLQELYVFVRKIHSSLVGNEKVRDDDPSDATECSDDEPAYS